MPIAFAAVTIPFMLREGKRAGQTLGKQLFRLRVVSDDHGDVSTRRATARELLVKAPFWTGLDLAAVPPGDRQRRLVDPRSRAARPPGPRDRHARRARDPPPQ